MNRRQVVVLVLVVASVAGIVSATYLADLGRSGSGSSLPAGCVRPAGGFLVVASNLGYNDSIGHGAPSNNWPIISVKQGSTVNITVCNTDRQAHSFQIAHYLTSATNTLAPGQVLHLKFVANQQGTFQIYCQVFCTIHVYMQSGQLRVTS